MAFSGLHTRRSIGLLALCATALWGFIEVADEVMTGDIQALDQAIVLFFRSPTDLGNPIGPPWLQEAVRDVTGLGGVAVLTLITLCAIGFLLVARAPKAAVAVTLAVAGGLALCTLLKAGFDRPRPDLVLHSTYVYSASFPSGHSMMSATVYLTLGALLASVLKAVRLQVFIIAIAISLTLLVGISRVYLGVHWPTDVLSGWLVGTSWASACSLIMLHLQVIHAVEESVDEDADGRCGGNTGSVDFGAESRHGDR